MKLSCAMAAIMAAALIVSGASAADLIIEEAPLPELEDAAWDWAGPYIGAHLGYAWGEAGVVETPENVVGDIRGSVYGLFAGINFQDGNLVFGLEGDAGIADVTGVGSPVPDPEEEYSYDVNWNAHARGRVGLAFDQVLVFVAGGLAIASHTLTEVYDQGNIGDDTQIHVGWTVGAGVEVAVTENLAVRAEYLYDDYGTKTYTFENTEVYDAFLTAHTVRAGISVGF